MDVCLKWHSFDSSSFTMKRRGRGVNVAGLLIFLNLEKHWLSVDIGSTLRLEFIFEIIFVLLSIAFLMKK